ncbi:MAG: acetyl-CoA hydrolase/transferase family protein, partial [Bacteroidota bacterium]
MKLAEKITAIEAARKVKSGDHVFIHGASAIPQALVNALAEVSGDLQYVRLYHLHLNGSFPLIGEEFRGIFSDNSFFMGDNVRQAVREKRADYIPVSLAELPLLLRRRVVPLDVALVSVSAPDKHGFVSLSTSVDVALAAVQSASLVIAQVNRYLPRTHGDGVLHLRDIDFIVEADIPLPIKAYPAPSAEEMEIGRHVAALVPDGATMQMGIGTMPNAVLSCLTGHKDLGVHTEMFSDGLLPLIESGVVNNSKKKVLPGRTVTSFAGGSQELYDFVDDNHALVFKDISWVNDPVIISRNPRVVAVNS